MNTENDPLGIERLRSAVEKLDAHMQQTVKPALDGDMLVEMDRVRKLNETLEQRHTQAKERLDLLMHNLQKNGLKT